MAIAKELDNTIISPMDNLTMADISAAEVIAGWDNFCMNYLKAFRAGAFE